MLEYADNSDVVSDLDAFAFAAAKLNYAHGSRKHRAQSGLHFLVEPAHDRIRSIISPGSPGLV